MEKLVSYLVDPPPPDADPKREYKYPYLACEIFSCEIDAILGALTDDDCALFSRVMSFIDVPPGTRLNSMLAGYFSKTVTCLVSRRAAECVGWFQSNPRFVNRLVEHVGTLAVAEVLLRLVGADDPGSMMPMQSMLLSAMGAGGDQSAWLCDTPLLDRLLEALDVDSDTADSGESEESPEEAAATRTTRQANAAEVLVGIARGAPSALATKLSGKDAMSKLFDGGLRTSGGSSSGYGDGSTGGGGNPDGTRVTAHDGASSSPLVNVLDIAIAIVDGKRAASGPMQAMRAMLAAETGAGAPPPRDAPPEALEACVDYLGPLVAQLERTGDSSSQRTTWGTITPPLGMRRVKIVDMIATLVGCKNEAVAAKVLETRALRKCADLFVAYPFNNFLHHHFENAVVGILEWGHPGLLTHLFTSAEDGGVDLVGVLTGAGRDVETTRGPVRAGNQGHVTRMANRLVAVSMGESIVSARDDRHEGRVGVGSYGDEPDDENDSVDDTEAKAEREAAAARSTAIVKAALGADTRWRVYTDGELGERNQVENVHKWACGRPAGMDDYGDSREEEEDDDGDFDIGLGAGFTRDSYHRYGGADDDEDEHDDGLGDSDDEDDLDPLTTRGAALLFQGDANARLASLTLGNGAGHPDVMIEEIGEEMDPYDDDDLDADTTEVLASVMSMFRAGGPSPETVGGAQDDDDEVNLADSDDDEIINSPDAKTERVEHDSPTLMKEYGASNFWGSSIDDSLVPDDI